MPAVVRRRMIATAWWLVPLEFIAIVALCYSTGSWQVWLIDIFVLGIPVFVLIMQRVLRPMARMAKEHDYSLCADCGYIIMQDGATYCPECGVALNLNECRERWKRWCMNSVFSG